MISVKYYFDMVSVHPFGINEFSISWFLAMLFSVCLAHGPQFFTLRGSSFVLVRVIGFLIIFYGN